MKKTFVYISLSLSLLLSAVVVPVSALSSADSSNKIAHADSTDKSEDNADDSANDATEDATDDSKSRTVRLDKYKKDLKETLTAASKLRIAERCIAAQSVVKLKKTNNIVSTNARTKSYDAIVVKLTSLSTAAAAKGADVTALNANITELKAKIVTFKSANTTFQQAVADLSVLDCKTDPVAFKAALETARTDQIAVFTAAKAIRSYLTDTVKPTLKVIKAALEGADN